MLYTLRKERRGGGGGWNDTAVVGGGGNLDGGCVFLCGLLSLLRMVCFGICWLVCLFCVVGGVVFSVFV